MIRSSQLDYTLVFDASGFLLQNCQQKELPVDTETKVSIGSDLKQAS